MDIVQAMTMPGSPLHRAYFAEGFVPLPERFWTTELHFGARGFSDWSHPLVTERSNWYLSLVDSDTV